MLFVMYYNGMHASIIYIFLSYFLGPASGRVCAAVISENRNISVQESAHWAYGVVPDVNECTLGLHKCHPNATCYNTLDSYTCKCKRGFVAVNGTKQCKKT